MAELEELSDLEEMLRSCIDNMNSKSSDLNLELGMPVFIVLEDRIGKCISQFHSKESEYTQEDVNQFSEAERTATDLLSSTKAGWSVEFREEYYRLVNKISYDAKIENVKDMTERVNNLKKLAMVLSKDLRGAGPGLPGPSPRVKRKELSMIDEEQKKYSGYQLRFSEEPEGRKCCCNIL